jgi:DNA-binding SARP family transcriptional activator
MPRVKTQTTSGAHRPASSDNGPATIQLELVRGFALRRGRQPLPIAASAQRLVALLALQDRPVLRLHAASTLWPDSSEERSSASLRSALWRLRANEPSVVEVASDQLRLSDAVAVDLRQIAERARRVMLVSSECAAEDLDDRWYSGDLLPGWYDDWVLVERERFRQLRLHALEAVTGRLISACRYGEAVQAALLAVREEPLRESAHRALVGAFLAEGNLREALVQYAHYRDSLYEELLVEPSLQFRQMIEDVHANGAARPSMPSD